MKTKINNKFDNRKSTATSKRRQTARNKNHMSVAVKVKHEPQEETTDDEQADTLKDICSRVQPPTSNKLASRWHKDNEDKCKFNESNRRAIVYTTRLDDMEVVMRSQHINEPTLFFRRILVESRPQITRKSFACKTPYVNRLESYMQLSYKILEANITSKRKAGWVERNIKKKVKEMVVEPSVSKDDKVTKVHKDKTPKQSFETTPRTKESIAVDTVVKDTKYLLYYYSYRDNYFTLKNIKTNKTDVYYFDDKGMVTQHYIYNHITSLLDNLFTQTTKNANVPYCCWYKREEFVLLMGRFLPVAAVMYLKSPHSCKINQCTCCCRNKTESRKPKTYKNSSTQTCLNQSNMNSPKSKTTPGIANINAEKKYVPVKTSVLIREMLMFSLAETSSFILNAFAYLPRERRRVKPRQMTNLIFLKYTNIFMNYKDKSNEFYEIGPEGEIRQHLKNVSESFIGERTASDPNLVNNTICCWYKREMFLHSLNAMHVYPKSKYIKTSHNCPIGNCICCCNPSKKSSGKSNLRQILLPNVSNHSENPCKLIPSLKFGFANTEPRTLDSLAAEHIKEIPPNNTEINEVPCSSTESAAKSVPVDNSQANELDDDDKYKFICDHAKYLIESKLGTCKNPCVSVNNKGKITATLNVPVTKLSTYELKVLSAILTQAQKNVDTSKRRIALKKSNDMMLNNSTTAALSTHSSIEIKSFLPTKLDPKQKSTFYSLMSYWSYTHDECHLRALKSLLHSQKINMSKKSGDSDKTKNKRTLADDSELSEDVKNTTKKQKSRKTNENNQIDEKEPLPPEVNVNGAKRDKQFEDPLAINIDNNINTSNQLKEQSDLTDSYPEVQLLNPKTLWKTSEVDPLLVMPQQLLPPWPAASPSLPSLVHPNLAAALSCTNTKLGADLPINSMVVLKDGNNTQGMDDNDCILGV